MHNTDNTIWIPYCIHGRIPAALSAPRCVSPKQPTRRPCLVVGTVYNMTPAPPSERKRRIRERGSRTRFANASECVYATWCRCVSVRRSWRAWAWQWEEEPWQSSFSFLFSVGGRSIWHHAFDSEGQPSVCLPECLSVGLRRNGQLSSPHFRAQCQQKLRDEEV